MGKRNRGGQMDLFDKDILSFDPFGPVRDERVRVFSDLFVVTRRSHDCDVCRQLIPARSRVRAKTEKCPGEGFFGTYYFCAECCDAMGHAARGKPEAFEARWAWPR